MKKSQRLRLAELKSKDAATLSAADKAEMETLEALAAKHTDAGKDEDDTKLSAAQFFSRLSAAFRDKADLAAKNSTQAGLLAVVATFLGVTTEALTAMAPAALTTALAAKATGGTQADANDAAVKAAQAERDTANSQLTTANTALATFATFLGVKADALPKGAELTTALNGRIDLRAGQRLSEMGFDEADLPAARKGAGLGGDIADLMEAYSKITDSQEAATFFAANIAPQIGQKSIQKPGQN